MIDAVTRKPLSVSAGWTAYPYIRVPFLQLNNLRQLLEKHSVDFWVSEDVISLDGGPEIAYVHLGHGADAETIQALLDDAGAE